MIRYLQYLPVALTVLGLLSRFFIRDGGVGVVNGVVVFLISWWVIIFMMLPIGVRSQEEGGEVVEGSEPGAPQSPMLKKKMWWTTVATSTLWVVYFIITESGLMAQFMPTGSFWG
ncbi:MAG: DUF1467 family protein [Alphaproteobacteria bacterium]|nr:DUF1467 family protein [Alphaproteobacteria bacterium]